MTSKYDLQVHTNLDAVHNDEIAIIRTSLLHLCEGNTCAAIILDDMYYKSYRTYDYLYRVNSRNKDYQLDRTLVTKLSELATMMSNMFNAQDIIASLELIASKDFAEIAISTSGDVTYRFFHRSVDTALKMLQGDPPPIEIRVENIPEILQFIPTEINTQVEPIDHAAKTPKRSESRKIEYHNNRASRVGLAATLTIARWTLTLNYFNWRCAFCSDGAYEVLEHFVPIIHGGGTTEYNCIPACASCNRIKNDTHPSMIKPESSIYQSIQNVQKYLESRRVNVEVEL